MVEHSLGKGEVKGSIPFVGSNDQDKNKIIDMAKKKKKAIRLQCTTCKKVNYFTNKTKNVEGKIELNKFCNECRKHVAHKEMKK